jgi:response regulator RpfG family c-di-GMP phosphodiesterase
MKLKRSEKKSGLPADTWKVLLVDDEPDVHEITRIALKKFAYDGKCLELISAYSAEQAREILQNDPDFALAIIDVVMETEEAGLDLVRFIREEMKLSHIRLIIRTGQPGKAPEHFVIQNFDIDDYREKTDLSNLKMITMLRNAIKSYRDISIIERNRIDLDQKVRERTRELNETNMKLEASVADLQKALRELKQLKGLVPICSYCKKIRDDKGYWHQLEAYIQAHSDAEFSHSICKDCADKFFPEMNLYDD